MPRLRIALALIIVSGIALCSSPILGWGSQLELQLATTLGNNAYAHALLRIFALLALCAACLLIPAHHNACMATQGIRYHAYARFLAIGTGLLLVIEPLIVLIILSYGSLFKDLHFLSLITPGRLPTDAHTSYITIGYFLLFIIITPICEEWFFRGRLFAWIRTHLDAISTVTLSSLAFAVAHANVLQSLIAIPLGLLLGFMRLRGASLRICITIHAMHNLLFLTLGGFLIVQPAVILACCVGGCWLLATGCAWKGPMHLPHRVLIFTLSGTIMAAVLSPAYIRLCDYLWAQAVYRQINNPRQFHEHLVICLQRSSIRPQAQKNLLDIFTKYPLNDQDRQFWVSVLFDSESIIQQCTDDQYAYTSLQHLSTYPGTLPAFQNLATAIAEKNPHTFINFVSHAPDFLKIWIPNGKSPRLSVLLQSSILQRRRLLRVILQAYSREQSLYALLRMQQSYIHPRDLMFIRSEFSEQEYIVGNALNILANENPQLAASWWKYLNG